MKKHDRRALCPSRQEVAELARTKEPNPPELPKDVIDALRRVRNCFDCVAVRITDVAYRCDLNREGLGIDLGCMADDIEMLLQKYNCSIGEAPFYWQKSPEIQRCQNLQAHGAHSAGARKSSKSERL